MISRRFLCRAVICARSARVLWRLQDCFRQKDDTQALRVFFQSFEKKGIIQALSGFSLKQTCAFPFRRTPLYPRRSFFDCKTILDRKMIPKPCGFFSKI
jgi:hypothetical protein